MSLRVYGHSDDLVLAEGDGISGEFYLPGGQEHLFLTFSSGVTLAVEYGVDAEWSVSELAAPDDVDVTVEPVGADGAPNDYTEVAVLEGGDLVEWVLPAEEIHRYKVAE